jgi:osmotically-inducible protein OsmY
MPLYLEVMQMNKPVFKKVFGPLLKPILVISLSCAAFVSLQGCVAFVVGGAVVGTMAATDRRTFGAQTEDKAIVLKGEAAIKRVLGDSAHINVNSFNRRALLTGEVVDEKSKQMAEQELRSIQGIEHIQNEIIISGLSGYPARSTDTVITTKVIASLIDARDINSASFKVVTEASTVFLMGRVTQREGSTAASIAAGVSGVRRVVKVFEYITEDELKAFTATPSKTDLN